MINVLFVCLGNICRSPMAEAVFRSLIKQKGLEKVISVDSAGTGDWHIGHMPHKGTQAILTQHKISFEGIKARQVQLTDFEEFEYIIGMDNENIKNLQKLIRDKKSGYIGRLLDFVPHIHTEEVPDPYFTGNFEEVYDLVQAGCNGLLEKIVKDHNLQ